MLLTIAAKGFNAANLSWLLHKRPDRFQTFDMGYAKAYVFFSRVEAEQCEACLLLETNQDKLNNLFRAKDGGFQYVNDRQYISTSMFATAIAQVFSSALKGVCTEKPEAAGQPMELTATIVNFPCRMDAACIHKFFAPLDYGVEWQQELLYEDFPEWGNCPYGELKLSGRIPLKDLLRHLYILIPVMDKRHHYWLDETHLQTFTKYTQGWLNRHPEKRSIIKKYFASSPALAKEAGDEWGLTETDPETSLKEQRDAALLEQLLHCGAKSVLDLGCGDGKLLIRLLSSKAFAYIVGLDVSAKALEHAKKYIKRHYPTARCDIVIGSLTYRDKRMQGFDAAVLSEVLEHFEPERMDAVMKNILAQARPAHLLVTTPNRAYNAAYAGLEQGQMRHPDHRYEFMEKEFQDFCQRQAAQYGYQVIFTSIGPEIDGLGRPTLMGIFKKCA